MRGSENDRVVVIGAGLAGLTAAATAARDGREVVVLEAHRPGGRARTDSRGGYRFNQGPHALYRGGPAWRILRELGVSHHGHNPPIRGIRGVRDGQLVRLLRGTQIPSIASKLATGRRASWAGRSASQWIDGLSLRPSEATLVRVGVRVATYVADLDGLPAEVAASQLRNALVRGVSYLDGGWNTLVEGLAAAATGAGADIRSHGAAVGIGGAPGGWEVIMAADEPLRAGAVVVATGGPASIRKLLPVDPGWGDLGPDVTAACLDLGLRGRRPPVVFGVDDPLYLSPHCPPGDLAPQGGSLVHLLRYGSRNGQADRDELWHLARLAGISREDVVEERFLARMVVSHALPSPERGLKGRPEVPVAGAPGLFVAGDWIGPIGWLADASMASGRRAGRLAVQAAGEGRLRQARVA
jgi:glycine/D-amino acid oxidase-like deaminating enzyme